MVPGAVWHEMFIAPERSIIFLAHLWAKGIVRS